MKTIDDLYAFAEELIEYAIMGGDDDTANVIEEALDTALSYENLDSQLAEMLMAFVSVEDRISLPDYPLESVVALRTMLRGMNSGANSQRYIH
jgi:restriction endonuclease Mrr